MTRNLTMRPLELPRYSATELSPLCLDERLTLQLDPLPLRRAATAPERRLRILLVGYLRATGNFPVLVSGT
jgi:hypothetical protein